MTSLQLTAMHNYSKNIAVNRPQQNIFNRVTADLLPNTELKNDIHTTYLSLGKVETTTSAAKSIIKWLFISLIRSVINIVAIIPLISIYWALILIWTCKCIRHKQMSKLKLSIRCKLIFTLLTVLLLNTFLFYWHWWSFFAYFFIGELWPGDIVMVVLTELSFEWIVARIARIITLDSKYPFVTDVISNNCIFRIFNKLKLRKFLPHKFKSTKMASNYNEFEHISFVIKNEYEKQDTMQIEPYLKLIDKLSISGNFHIIESVIFVIVLIIAVFIIWYGYIITNYEYMSDIICFTIWEIWFISLVWSYYKYHISSEFLSYYYKMKLLIELINDNYNKLLKKRYPNAQVVLLSNDENIRTWMILWSKIRCISWDYFDKQKYFIISTFSLFVFSSLFGIVRTFLFSFSVVTLSAENEDIIFYGSPSTLYFTLCGLILLKLMFLSFQFPKIEKKQIRCILDQQFVIDDITIKLNMQSMNQDVKQQDDDNDNYYDYNQSDKMRTRKIKYLRAVSKQLTRLIQHIEVKSISPKIAGIPMNALFLRLLWTMFIFSITTGITYLFDNIK